MTFNTTVNLPLHCSAFVANGTEPSFNIPALKAPHVDTSVRFVVCEIFILALKSRN